MHVDKRTALHPLTLAITLALAACGGGQDTPRPMLAARRPRPPPI